MNFNDIKNLSSIIVGIVVACVISIPSILLAIKEHQYKKKDKHTKKLKFEGIEQASEGIINFHFEKINEQFRVVEEQSKILYNKMTKIHLEIMKIEKNSDEYKSLMYDMVRFKEFTDKEMKVVIYNNRISSRTNDDWLNYKKDKTEFIFSECTALGEKFYNERNSCVPYEELSKILLPRIKEIYIEYIGYIFDQIRNKSIEYDEKIENLKKIRENLKNEQV